MYRVALKICLYGAIHGPALLPILESVMAPERFATHFSCHGIPSQQTVSEADVVILADGIAEDLLYTLRTWQKKRSVVVLCDDTPSFKALEQVDRLWPANLSPAVAVFHFSGLLSYLKMRKDKWLIENYLDTTINSIPDLVWYKDVKGSHLKVNQSFCGAVGKTMEQIENRGHLYIWDIPKEEYEQGEYICMESEYDTMANRGIPCLFDENVKTKQGMRKFKTWKTALLEEDLDEILGTVGVARDVTDYLNLGSELNSLMDNLPLGILMCDLDWEIELTNQAFKNMFSNKSQLLSGENYRSWKERVLRDTRAGREPQRQDATVHQESETFIVDFEEIPLKDVFGTHIGYMCLFRDATLMRTYEAQIAYYANNDMLTGLATRRHFNEQLETRGIPNAMIFLDVDNFKQVNDKYGHHYGDLALQTVASGLLNAFPNGICSRNGGDEFIVAIYDNQTTEQALSDAITALQCKLNQSTLGCPENFHLTISVGIAYAEDDLVNFEELIRRSDLAMYAAKRRGKRTSCLYHKELEF